jgi:predicted transcriptional regulator
MAIITGKTIKRMRQEAGLSQTRLAELARISQAHVAKIETGRVDPRLSTVNRILSVIEGSGSKTLCRDIMQKEIVSLGPRDPVERAIEIMHNQGISQIPIFREEKQIGSIREATIMKNLDKRLEQFKVGEILDKPFPVVDGGDSIEILPGLLDFHPAVLVSVRGRIRGIITKSDLLETKR